MKIVNVALALATGGALLIAGTTLAATQNDTPSKMEQIRKDGNIEIAIYQDFPPWSYPAEDGGYTGIDVDIAKALADKLGVGLTLYPFRHDETMSDDIRNRVWKGHYIGRPPSDAMIHVGMAPAFQKRNDNATFVGAYYNETMGLAYDSKRFGKDVKSPLALAGHPIGAEVDTLGAFYLDSAFEGTLRNDVKHFMGVPAAMRALNQGKLAGVVAPVGELRGTAHMLDDKKVSIRNIKLTGMYQTNWDVGVAVKTGNDKLAAALDQAMAELRTSGALKEIFQNYGLPYRPPHSISDNATKTAAAK
ncbi:MAG: transporter substrate-binding domain-containing protein [Salinisphaera sp.]|nr:transporter substrate-binding domain-containing protein [Salinisphaera sp.]